MILLPAIDLFGGKVVRLTQGDFDTRRDYGVDALDTAKQFMDAGCAYIHVVDLEGAKQGQPCHLNILENIAKLGMYVQYGGGLRSEEAVADALSAGAGRVMVGSLLFTDKDAPARLFDRFGSAVMPSVDIKNGKVVHSGWLKGTDSLPADEIKKFKICGYNVFLVTDTERDGKMEGARRELYEPLVSDNHEIVAAGGITSADDLKMLAETGVAGAVIGKSLYEGGITLEEALAAVKGK